jgi:hypothetical protein
VVTDYRKNDDSSDYEGQRVWIFQEKSTGKFFSLTVWDNSWGGVGEDFRPSGGFVEVAPYDEVITRTRFAPVAGGEIREIPEE